MRKKRGRNSFKRRVVNYHILYNVMYVVLLVMRKKGIQEESSEAVYEEVVNYHIKNTCTSSHASKDIIL